MGLAVGDDVGLDVGFDVGFEVGFDVGHDDGFLVGLMSEMKLALTSNSLLVVRSALG